MFRTLKLSTKLYFGFGIILAMLAVIAGGSLWLTNNIVENNEKYAQAADHAEFIVAKEVDHLKWIYTVAQLFQENLQTLNVQLDPTKCSLGLFLHGDTAKALADQDPKIAALLSGIMEPHRQLHESAKNIAKAWKQRHPGLRENLNGLTSDLNIWSEDFHQMVISRDSAIQLETDPAKTKFAAFLRSPEYATYTEATPTLNDTMQAAYGSFQKLLKSAARIKGLLGQGNTEEASALSKETTADTDAIRTLIAKAIDAENGLIKSQEEAHAIFDNQTLPALEATQVKLKAIRDRLQETKAAATKEIRTGAATAIWSVVVVGAAAIIFGALLTFLLVGSISKPINKAILGLKRGAEQVASASTQVAAASQSLAEGASEQAAAIEETSSSLEEMSAMTNQNAENAGQADNVMREAKATVARADESMSKLSSSMDEISSASAETSKIIKTIDEIAFQTNLLALNAAVEAARAGEAGAGFAVVAGEVRNLAMRAAEAAKNTAHLIQGTVSRVDEGTALVKKTNEEFVELSNNATKAGDLVAEIAAASNEQALGIDQVNKAIGEMDKVTQQNAANAEESASAAQEMYAQAAIMRQSVADLIALIEGAGKNNRNGSDLAETANVKSSHTSRASGERLGAKVVDPEFLIPLKKDDPDDF